MRTLTENEDHYDNNFGLGFDFGPLRHPYGQDQRMLKLYYTHYRGCHKKK